MKVSELKQLVKEEAKTALKESLLKESKPGYENEQTFKVIMEITTNDDEKLDNGTEGEAGFFINNKFACTFFNYMLGIDPDLPLPMITPMSARDAFDKVKDRYSVTIERRHVGIDIKTEPLEQGVFLDKMFTHKLDAWLGGWSIPIPLDLKLYWYSNLALAPLNITGYKNDRADELLDKIEKAKSDSDKNKLFKELQSVLADDCPVSFLYWIDNITAYNQRVQNIHITPLGPINRCWEWSVKN